jgi:hypothetical protein
MRRSKAQTISTRDSLRYLFGNASIRDGAIRATYSLQGRCVFGTAAAISVRVQDIRVYSFAHRGVEQGHHVGIHVLNTDFDTAENVAPLCLAVGNDAGEVPVGDLLLGIAACLCGGDERDPDAGQDGRCVRCSVLREGKQAAVLGSPACISFGSESRVV